MTNMYLPDSLQAKGKVLGAMYHVRFHSDSKRAKSRAMSASQLALFNRPGARPPGWGTWSFNPRKCQGR